METTGEQFPAAPDIARRLPAYRLVRQLARSEMSVVYLAQEVALGRNVALKILSPESVPDASFRERFAREVAIAARLDHPNIIPVHAAGDSQGLLYLAMRYVDGPDLGAWLRTTGPLSLAYAIRVISQIAAALSAAHAAGLVHRDVKPGNVLLDRACDHVYLCDFGIAKHALGAQITKAGQFVGTIHYVAPEQIQAQPIDRRTDVYSLGAVLFQCLTGTPPYVRDELAGVLWAHLNEVPPRVTDRRPDLPARLNAVVATALAKDPRNRYPSCQDLVDALIAAAAPNDGPTVGRPAPRPAPPDPRSRPSPRGRRWALAIMALVAVGVLVIAGFVVADRFVGNEPGADLLARVPEALRGDCGYAAAPGGSTAAATLSCRSVDGQEVVISLFDTQSGVDQAYGEIVRRADVARGSGDCAIRTDGEHRFPGVGALIGRVLCYRQDGGTSLVWTDDAARTVAGVTRADGNDLELYRFWATLFGVQSFPTPDEQAVLDVVPETDCRRAPAGSLDQFPGVLAAIECEAEDTGASTVSYYRFADLDGLRRSYNTHVSDVGAATGGPDCEDGAAPGFLVENSWNLRTVEIGRLLCYSEPQGKLVMEWTAEPLRILARAVGTDPVALGEWWIYNSGPRAEDVIKAVNAQAQPRFPTPTEQALLDRIPAGSQVDCTRPSPERVSEDLRGTPVAAIVCDPRSGADSVFYYQLPDNTSTAENYGEYVFTGPDCAGAPPNFEGEAEYSRNGTVTGRLSCTTTDAGSLQLVWTHDQLNVLVFAFYEGDPARLLSWWRDDAGPV